MLPFPIPSLNWFTILIPNVGFKTAIHLYDMNRIKRRRIFLHHKGKKISLLYIEIGELATKELPLVQIPLLPLLVTPPMPILQPPLNIHRITPLPVHHDLIRHQIHIDPRLRMETEREGKQEKNKAKKESCPQVGDTVESQN